MQLASERPIPALGVTLREHRHPSGLLHLHLACGDEHRACAIAFRTPPGDSSGAPHILEHTVLCGSRRYPVRDPFFNMLRRSLATFMNALTYGDLTAYPFATQVSRDWDNLLAVYLDAVFAPQLDQRDFLQEGHRLARGPDGAWARQGVVFNEMLGALDSTAAQVANALSRALLPDTIYRHESGGDPADIPLLTHAGLVDFHRRCYAPANAVVATYGELDEAAFHAAMAPYLAAPGRALPPPARQPPLGAPQRLAVPVPLGEGQLPEDVTAAGIAWCWGDTADIDEVLAAELVERLLLGHAGAPLRLALESAGIGRGSGDSGYSGGARNGMFTAEIEGIAPGEESQVEPLVLAALERVAAAGVPAAEVAAALHQLELSRREIRGDGWPYGLELGLRLCGAWNLGADPLPFLDSAPALDRLRRAAADPAWIRDEVRRRLLANPHRAVYAAIPDPSFHRRQRERIAARDAAELARPGAEAALAAAAAALAERQAAADDPAVLPDLDLADVPRRRRWAEGRAAPWPGGALTVFPTATNGLMHLIAALPLPGDAPVELLPLLAASLGGLGCGDRGYAEQAALLNACSGGVRAWVETGADPDDPALARPWFLVEVKGLEERAADFLPLLAQTLRGTRFDEGPRLAELVRQALATLQERVVRSGAGLAASAAQRGLRGVAGLSHRLGGLGRLAWLKRTAADLDGGTAPAALARLGDDLAALRRILAAAAPHAALIGGPAARPELLAAAWPEAASAPAASGGVRLPGAGTVADTAYTTGTAVNHTALAFAAPALRHPQAAALAVGARILVNRWLHPRIRERGGAYGGGAQYGGGAFTLTSYRDPRLAETYADMRAGLAWLAGFADDAAALKEAKLGVLQALDAPGSPAGEARRRFLGDLTGRDPATIETFRTSILAATCAEVRAAVAAWLPPEGGTAACITAPARAAALGWAAEPV